MRLVGQASIILRLCDPILLKDAVTANSFINSMPSRDVISYKLQWQCFSVPLNRRELRFSGMAGYYRGFSCNFADVASPLSTLTRTNRAFLWSIECQKTFKSVKALLSWQLLTSSVLSNWKWVFVHLVPGRFCFSRTLMGLSFSLDAEQNRWRQKPFVDPVHYAFICFCFFSQMCSLNQRLMRSSLLLKYIGGLSFSCIVCS